MIDLGEVSAAPAVGATRRGAWPREAWPEREAGPRRGTWQRRRIAWIAVIALAMFGTVTASVARSAPLAIAARIPIGDGAQFMVAGAHAIVIDDHDGNARISSYALPGGRREWTAKAAGIAFYSDLASTGSSVIAMMPRPNLGGEIVEVVDMRTGALRWQRPVGAVDVLPEGLLVYSWFTPDVGNTMSLVDPDSGVARWQLAIPPDCATATADDVSQTMADGLVELCRNTGELSVIDLYTGHLRARRHVDIVPSSLPGSEAAAEAFGRAGVLYVGAATLLMIDNYPRLSVSGFRTSDLAPLWSGLPMNANDRFERCGVDVCLGGEESATTIDPETGRPVRAAEVRPDLWQPSTLIVIPDDASYAAVMRGSAPFAQVPTPAGTSIEVPAVSQGPGPTWVAIASAASIRLLQPLRGVRSDACLAIADYIACATVYRQLTLWHLS